MHCYNTLNAEVKKDFNKVLIILNIAVIISFFRLILLCMVNILNLTIMDIIIIVIQCCVGIFDVIYLIHVLLNLLYIDTFDEEQIEYSFIWFMVIAEFVMEIVPSLHIIAASPLFSSIAIYHFIVLGLSSIPFMYLGIKYIIILPIIHFRKYVTELNARINNRMIRQELLTQPQ